MVGPLAIDICLPSFPAIGHDFHVGPFLVQQTLGVYLLTFGFMMLFHGALSDSFGRRPVILTSLLIYTLASIGVATASTFSYFLVGRAVQGFAAGAGAVVAQAIVRDQVAGKEAQRVLARITMVFGLAPAFAPILGGLLQTAFGWRSTFLFLVAFGALMLIVCCLNLPESLPPHARQPFQLRGIARNYWMTLTTPRFLAFTSSIGLSFGGLALYFGSGAFFVVDILRLPETAFGWLSIPLMAGVMLGSAVASSLTNRLPIKGIILTGYLVMAASGLLNLLYAKYFPPSVPWAVLPLMTYTLGMSIANPSLVVAALDCFPNQRGLASSVQSFVQMMISAAIVGIGVPLLFNTAERMATWVLVGVGLSFVCWQLSNWHPDRRPFPTV